MASFEVADSPTRVPLKEEGPSGSSVQAGMVTLTVRNTTDRRQTGRLKIEPAGQTKPEWLSFEGALPTSPREIERDFEPRANQTHRIRIAVPAGAAPGPQLFNVRVTAEDDPDNDSLVGPSVAFDVAKWTEAPTPSTRIPWWPFAVAAAAVLIVGGVVGWLIFGPSGSRQIDVVGKTQAEATVLLKQAGFADANIRFPKDAMPSKHEPNTVARVVYASDNVSVDAFLDPGVVVPPARNLPLEDVSLDFSRKGFLIMVAAGSEAGIGEGNVISTVPQSGMTVASGTKATITFNKPRGPLCPGRLPFCVFEGANSVIGAGGSVNSTVLIDRLKDVTVRDPVFRSRFNEIVDH